MPALITPILVLFVSVTGAAVTAVTSNLDIRAGSCVLPLHHPARVAEEWAVIDNISNGRAGIAFAAGWMPEDFLLRPVFLSGRAPVLDSIDKRSTDPAAAAAHRKAVAEQAREDAKGGLDVAHLGC